MTKNKAYHYPQLTGVRAIAAYMVFLHHFTPMIFGVAAYSFMRELHVGVPVFFVLSGFLIYLRYADSFTLKKSWVLSYYQNRFAKIYPSYFFVVLLNFIVFGNLLYFLLQITFIRGFFKDYLFVGVSQGWTLTVEFCFYALFPLLLVCIKRVGFLLPLLAIYVVGMLLTKAANYFPFHGLMGSTDFVVGYTFFGNASEFFVGMYTAKVILGFEAGRLDLKDRGSTVTLLSVCGVLLCIYCLSTLASDDYVFGVLSPMGRAVDHIMLPCFIGALFYGLITETSLIRSLLQNKLMVLLGESSYIFYLIHMGVFSELMESHLTKNYMMMFILLNMIAIFFYFTIEKPCHRFLKNFRRVGEDKKELAMSS